MPTSTNTPTATSTPEATNTPLATNTALPTNTAVPTSTNTPTATSTAEPTATEEPGSTTMTEQADSGDTEIEVASTDGFNVNDIIVINPGGLTEEQNQVTGFGSLLLLNPLAYEHFPGEVVEVVVNPQPTATSTVPVTRTAVVTRTARATRTATVKPATRTATAKPATRTATVQPATRTTVPQPEEPCADVTGDGKVTVRDLIEIAKRIGAHKGHWWNHWSHWGYQQKYDLNRNGRIDVWDLLIALDQLGRYCRQ
ncbi:MAG: dockerin type I domain-containing protein [Dehalococcoidia bacterium]